jgi:WXG100 family type VII secretion target
MATIHVNTDVMRQLGNRFLDWNNKMQNEMNPELRNLTAHLESDWQGVSRAHYDELVQRWEQNIANLVNNGEELGRHLTTTAQQFDEADRS